MKSKEQPSAFPDVIATKLHPPQSRRSIVHRQRLFDKLNGAPAKLILVAAPAGFGKSTLIIDWLHENKKTYAWLSLEETENDQRRFYQYIVTTLQTVNASLGDKLVPALQGSSVPSSETIITHLINDIYEYGGSIKLVLDDYYFIEERGIHHAVNFLIEHLPPNMQLVISTRVDPLLPLHRMRARGELIEIRERDLRFTPEEASGFFESMHIRLSPDDINQLATRTEGWIAGLQLAAVSLNETRDVKKFIDSFTGSSRYVLDYLVEEVLNRQSKEIQMFLLQTSILKRFNADICNMITGGMNAQKIIEQLERSNLFLIPLDERREWFRYHHLFSELLQYRLRQLYPGLIEELHHNASLWFEERNTINEAIDYALRVKNFERAAYLLDRYGVEYLSRSELSTLINYEQKLPESLVSRFPQLLVTKAWALMLMHRTDEIDTTIDAAEQIINSARNEDADEKLEQAQIHLATIRAFVLRLRGNLTASLEASNKVLERIPADQKMVRGLIHFNIGRIYMKQGYADEAIRIFERAYDDNYEVKNYYVTMAILAHAGFLYSITHSLPYACKKLEDALRFTERQNLDSLPAAGYIYYQLGRVLYHRNKLEDALDLLDRAIRLGELGGEPDILCNALLVSSWIYAIKGEYDNALEKFSRAEMIKQNNPIPVFEADLMTERIALAFLMKEYDRVKRWIDTIEPAVPVEFTVLEETQSLLVIRFFIHDNEFHKALRLIEKLRTRATERQRRHTLFQLDILEAISLWGIGNKEGVVQLLNHGLQQASEMGYIRVLLNLGAPLHNVLSSILHDKALSETSRNFALDLLQILTRRLEPRYTSIPKYKQHLIEPLTDREQEVLYYISQDYSNKEIAGKLFVSLDTVKTHLKNLYGKLGVNSRQDAVKKAREMEVLTN